jgi:hypothetical protein
VHVARAQHKLRAIARDLVHARLLAHVGAQAPRGQREGRRHQARIRLPVARAQRGADGGPAQPGTALAQGARGQHLQIHAEALVRSR